MKLNGDLYDRIKYRLFRSHFNSSRRGDFAQARSGTGQILQLNGKFRQVNGLWDGGDTCARASSLSSNPVERNEGEFILARENLAPEGRLNLAQRFIAGKGRANNSSPGGDDRVLPRTPPALTLIPGLEADARRVMAEASNHGG
jgi:hypothetical protein